MKNILVIRFSSLGDLVTQDLTYRAFRHFYNDSRIVFLTSSIGKALYLESNYFDEFITIDKANQIPTLLYANKFKFDIIFDLQCGSKSFLITFFAEKTLLLHQSANWWQKLIRIKPKPKWYPELLELSGVEKQLVDEYVAIKNNSMIQLQFFQKRFEWLNPKKKSIALAIGASGKWKSKKWGDDKFLELANVLISKNYTVILIGSKLESEAGEKICSHNSQILNLINKTSLSELKSILASIDLLVSNDSGPSHLAAGVGTDTLTIFGPTDIKHRASSDIYFGRHEYIVANPRLSCQPCYKGVCPTNHDCMKIIKADQVIEIITNIIQSKI